MSTEQELGSVISYFYSKYPVMVYKGEMKQGFAVPSLYFPFPFSFDTPDTVTTYRNTYTMQVKLFHESTEKAYEEDDKIVQALRAERSLIPLKNANGSLADGYIRMTRCDLREGSAGVAFINLTWDSRYKYNREVFMKMGALYLNSEVRE